VKKVHCTGGDALGMVTIDVSGFRVWAQARGRTWLGRGEFVSPKCSMATQFGTPRRCEKGPLPLRGCSGHGYHRRLRLSRVVANSRTHPVGAG